MKRLLLLLVVVAAAALILAALAGGRRCGPWPCGLHGVESSHVLQPLPGPGRNSRFNSVGVTR